MHVVTRLVILHLIISLCSLFDASFCIPQRKRSMIESPHFARNGCLSEVSWQDLESTVRSFRMERGALFCFVILNNVTYLLKLSLFIFKVAACSSGPKSEFQCVKAHIVVISFASCTRIPV